MLQGPSGKNAYELPRGNDTGTAEELPTKTTIEVFPKLPFHVKSLAEKIGF